MLRGFFILFCRIIVSIPSSPNTKRTAYTSRSRHEKMSLIEKYWKNGTRIIKYQFTTIVKRRALPFMMGTEDY